MDHPPPTIASTSSLLHDLDTHGYTILRSHIPPARLSSLLHSSRKLTQAARSGRWPHLRTCPKQFPPWQSTPPSAGIWGVQHLLHPALYSSDSTINDGPPLSQDEAAAFAELYFSDALLDPIAAILSPPSTASNPTDTETAVPLTMELLNLLVAPPSPFHLRWHRDSIPFSLSPADEAIALGLIHTSHSVSHTGDHGHNPFATTEHSYYTLHPAFRQHRHAQYNIPLLRDSSLQLVPGSHLRPRTGEELAVLDGKEGDGAEIPGAVVVHLEPGDVVFYNANLIHRGVYEGYGEGDGGGENERYTIHGSVSRADIGTERARTVLQHGVGEWIDDCDFARLLDRAQVEDGARIGERAEAMRRRLLELGGEGAKDADSVGYYHEG